ncbi:MAG: tetraacyldisaccharide 4'-kinase, partial [Candidatus Omnitrophica bacterium]|nr:tetraacyldisaccharide 4'-kinase [Candidatus Omnitrophota bacterium]
VYVIKGRDRLKNARQSGGMHASKVFILDDGFQHRRLKRDLDIVLVDSHDGFGNGRIFPGGTLREPPSAIKRADVVVLTKSDFGKDNVRNLRIILSGKFKKHKSLEAIYKPSWLYSLRDGSRKEIDAIRSKKVSLVSAVANPAYFKYMVNNLGAEIIHKMDFPDHHNYTQKDFERIEKTAIEQGCEYVVVTEKDMVKLAKLDIKNLKLEILVLHVELEITKGMEELVAGLNSMLSS